jgi:hypothetical protein
VSETNHPGFPDFSKTAIPSFGSTCKEPRRIVQISACGGSAGTKPYVAALCNDGSVWAITTGADKWKEWEQLPGIPQ